MATEHAGNGIKEPFVPSNYEAEGVKLLILMNWGRRDGLESGDGCPEGLDSVLSGVVSDRSKDSGEPGFELRVFRWNGLRSWHFFANQYILMIFFDRCKS